MRRDFTVLLSLLVAGCSGENTLAGPGGGLIFADAGISPVTGQAGDAGQGGDGGGAGGSQQALDGLPCDVEKVIVTYCVACHGEKPVGPMPLLQYADFTASALSDPAKTVAQRSLEMMQGGTMPPGGGQLSSSELQTYQAWVESGLPKGSCAASPSADAGPGGAGVDGGSTAVIPGLPCEVSTLLGQFCVSCHSTHPVGGAPMSTMTYADLTAPAPSDSSKTVAELSLELMNSSPKPMPPAGARPDAALLQAFSDWVSNGTPETGCGTADAGTIVDPYATPVVCTSGNHWSRGEGSTMRPGQACISCHAREREAPIFSIAGTVYPSAHEPDLCNGTGANPVVEITDANGGVHQLTANSAGNFSLRQSIATPYTARVLYQGRSLPMFDAQSNGDCNTCHTESGANGAPGRIMLP